MTLSGKIEDMKARDVKEIFVVFLFIFPMITRWLFPSSIEARLTILLLGYFPFYLADICYLLFPFFAKFKRCAGTLRICSYFLFIQFITTSISFYVNEYTELRLAIWGNMYYFFAMLFVLYYSFTEKQIRMAGLAFFVVFFLLAAQIFLYSTGILSYSVEISNHEYAGVNRISTTIGAATGTGVIMFMLGGVIFYLYEETKFKYLILLAWGISVFLTISRGPSLAFILFIIYFLYKEIRVSREKLRTFFKLTVSFLLLGTILYFSGFMNPLLERSVDMSETDNVTSGREDIFKQGIQIFLSNPVWGVGYGNVFFTKDLSLYSTFVPTHPLATHNYYTLNLIERGVVGFTFFIFTFFFLLRRLPYLSCSLCAVLLITMLILFNTEAIFIDSEYMFLIAFILSLCIHNSTMLFPRLLK